MAIAKQSLKTRTCFNQTEIGAGNEGNFMLQWSITFLIVALLAGVLGFFAIAGIAASIAKVLFVIFLVLFLASLIQRNTQP